VDALEQEGGVSRRSDKEDGYGKPSDTFPSFCVPILRLAMLLLCTLISNKIFTNVQAPGSENADPRLPECNLMST